MKKCNERQVKREGCPDNASNPSLADLMGAYLRCYEEQDRLYVELTKRFQGNQGKMFIYGNSGFRVTSGLSGSFQVQDSSDIEIVK